MSARTISIKGNVFGANCSTTIPVNPTTGTSYRKTDISSSTIKNGWSYKTLVDSANFNQCMYELASMVNEMEKSGILTWSALTDYPTGSFCIDPTNGYLYKASNPSGPNSGGTHQPSASGSQNYWGIADIGSKLSIPPATASALGLVKIGNGINVAVDGTITLPNWAIIPIGSVVAFAGNAIPQGGWLLCNGGTVSISDYANLFSVIGNFFGGDGTTTFALPNLIDKFVEGGSTRVASIDAGLPNVTGTLFSRPWDGNFLGAIVGNSGAFYSRAEKGGPSGSDYTPLSGTGGTIQYHSDRFEFNASYSNSIFGNAQTVQPSAVKMYYYIKY